MSTFEKTVYKIKKRQYLKDVEPFKTNGIPTCVFLYKLLPGLGATECEIRMLRHSIILETNVPVIIGKCVNEQVLGVFEGVTVQRIIDYLNNGVEHKKILVTPESFFKVKEAIQESDFDLYNDFFLLFDECEKIIQDADYRPNITLPMDDFFLFKEKAFVSATPIFPSDPRFVTAGFKIIEMEPTFQFSQPIKLITTNNVFNSLSKFIRDNQREMYFIFFNSTDNIAAFIKQAKIMDQSMIFCAKESAKKLKANDFENVSTTLTTFFKFNFLTSRFFSAVDIDYKTYSCNPTIIMVSDLVFAAHSKIDPFTEAVQIPGRFRAPKGKAIKREIVHISNLQPDISFMNESEVAKYLEDGKTVYDYIDLYYEGTTSIHAKEVLRQMLTRIDYANYIKLPEKLRHYFMVDNLMADEKVKSYYQSTNALTDAYNSSRHYTLTLPTLTEFYTYSDEDRLKARPKNIPLKDLKKILAEKLQQLHRKKDSLSEFEYNIEMSNLQFDFAEQIAPVNRYGLDNALEFNFNIKLIEQELKRKSQTKDFFELLTYIKIAFRVGGVYTTETIAELLQTGMQSYKIYGRKPTVQYFRTFVEMSSSNKRVFMGRDEQGKEIRGYKIFRFKDNGLK